MKMVKRGVEWNEDKEWTREGWKGRRVGLRGIEGNRKEHMEKWKEVGDVHVKEEGDGRGDESRWEQQSDTLLTVA